MQHMGFRIEVWEIRSTSIITCDTESGSKLDNCTVDLGVNNNNIMTNNEITYKEEPTCNTNSEWFMKQSTAQGTQIEKLN